MIGREIRTETDSMVMVTWRVGLFSVRRPVPPHFDNHLADHAGCFARTHASSATMLEQGRRNRLQTFLQLSIRMVPTSPAPEPHRHPGYDDAPTAPCDAGIRDSGLRRRHHSIQRLCCNKVKLSPWKKSP